MARGAILLAVVILAGGCASAAGRQSTATLYPPDMCVAMRGGALHIAAVTTGEPNCAQVAHTISNRDSAHWTAAVPAIPPAWATTMRCLTSLDAGITLDVVDDGTPDAELVAADVCARVPSR